MLFSFTPNLRWCGWGDGEVWHKGRSGQKRISTFWTGLVEIILRLREVCCGADWEHCMSCDGDTAENVITHAWGGIFLGCFSVSLSGSVTAVRLLKC